jgi:hypothetical protein
MDVTQKSAKSTDSSWGSSVDFWKERSSATALQAAVKAGKYRLILMSPT